MRLQAFATVSYREANGVAGLPDIRRSSGQDPAYDSDAYSPVLRAPQLLSFCREDAVVVGMLGSIERMMGRINQQRRAGRVLRDKCANPKVASQ
jgi:hypothetical protein